MPKNPVYNIFLDCKKFASDPFWIQQFDDCSNGKFPRGIKYKYIQSTKNGILHIKRPNGTTVEYNIQDTDDPEKIYNLIQNVFKSMGISSSIDSDVLKNEMEFQRIETSNKDSWTEIRQKKARQIMVINYCIAYSIKHNLKPKQKNQLYNTIWYGISGNSITSNDIIVVDGNITIVNGVEFSEETGKFYCKHTAKDDSSTTVKSNIIHMKDLWEKCKKICIKQKGKFT